ncbi:hypothetical protein CDC45_09450 [Ralstonia pseudosolanacearum]|nr:hypothetical protein CDC45_09450 [Ralstonia pseudosolanacearum]
MPTVVRRSIMQSSVAPIAPHAAPRADPAAGGSRNRDDLDDRSIPAAAWRRADRSAAIFVSKVRFL